MVVQHHPTNFISPSPSNSKQHQSPSHPIMEQTNALKGVHLALEVEDYESACIVGNYPKSPTPTPHKPKPTMEVQQPTPPCTFVALHVAKACPPSQSLPRQYPHPTNQSLPYIPHAPSLHPSSHLLAMHLHNATVATPMPSPLMHPQAPRLCNNNISCRLPSLPNNNNSTLWLGIQYPPKGQRGWFLSTTATMHPKHLATIAGCTSHLATTSHAPQCSSTVRQTLPSQHP